MIPAANRRSFAKLQLRSGPLRLEHVVLAALAVVLGILPSRVYADSPVYRSPIDVAFSPDGTLLAAADPSWGGVVIIDPQKRTVLREVALVGNPANVIWNGNDKVLVSEANKGTVAEVNATNGALIRRLTVARRAAGLARTSDGKLLLVSDRGLNRVVFVDLGSGEVTRTVEVVREPGFIALTADDRYAIVGNKLPRSEDARLTDHAAEVSIIELSTGNVRNVRLPGGSSIVRQIAISPDNRWAYVLHQAGRANTMVTQLDKGWVMTNCTSIIDIAEASLYTTFLFDREGAGAANPWGIAVSPDGSTLWATLAGISQIATVDLKALHTLLADDQNTRTTLHRDLQTMYGQNLLTRRTVSSVEGTRGLAVSPDGNTLAVAAYFEGKVLLVDVATEQVQTVALANNPDEDAVRSGERYYNSGLNCFQQWLSCATCHEGGRMDGLNWDLLNDGQGNPKNTRSHILSAVTPPTNITGCREDALVSARAGYSNIEFQPAPEDRVSATYAYIQSLIPEPSPFLGPDGKLTADAVEGKKLFESDETACSRCHTGSNFTDMHRYDVGTRIVPPDISSWDDGGYDVPTLVELWRTAPYLHLGHATTLKDVLTSFNKNDRHGKTSQLSPNQLDQLVAYLMQIGPTDEVAATQADAGADPMKSDAGTITPMPGNTDHPTDSKRGGCICSMGGFSGASNDASMNRMLLVGLAMVMFTVWQRRRASR
jgi:DNA-binding beta-propeller fold protein YncE